LAAALVLVTWIAFTPSAFADSLEIYTRRPDAATCDSGSLSQVEKDKVLEYLNFIRSLHQLEPVNYDFESDDETAEGSLIIAANKQATHTPDPSFACYTDTGRNGTETSNVNFAVFGSSRSEPLLTSSSFDIVQYLIDDNVPSLSHRRWLLNPFLEKVSYGRVDLHSPGDASGEVVHGSILKVVYEEKATLPPSTPSFVAYPQGDYPLDLFKLDWFWSFSAVADAADYWNNDLVDYGEATITVTSNRGAHRVHSRAHNTDSAGLANMIQWRVDDVRVAEAYQVHVSDVRVKGQLKDFEYQVTITPPTFREFQIPVLDSSVSTSAFEVKSGNELALFVAPPGVTALQASALGQIRDVQVAPHSPYVNLVKVEGVVGDEVTLHFAEGRSATLRIAESEEGVSDPLVALNRDYGGPVIVVRKAAEQIPIKAGMEFAVFVSPPRENAFEYTTLGRETQVEVQPYSRYASLFRISGGFGDEVVLRFPDGGTATLRIAETEEGITDPLEALAREIGGQAFMVTGKNETVPVKPDRPFAVYVPPVGDGAGIGALSWTAPAAAELSFEFYNSHTLIGRFTSATPGDQATVNFSGGRVFVIEIALNR
jgi:hypothetical protein